MSSFQTLPARSRWFLALAIAQFGGGCATMKQEPVECVRPTLTIAQATSFTQRDFTSVSGSLTCSDPGGLPIGGSSVEVVLPDTMLTAITNNGGSYAAAVTMKTYDTGDPVVATALGRARATAGIAVAP